MNRTGLLLTVLLMTLSAACAVNEETDGRSEPQVTLRTLSPGEAKDNHFRARLARIDGRAIAQGSRRTFELAPGTHTLAFELDVESLHTYQRGGPETPFPKPGPSTAELLEKTLDVELEVGRNYKFGAIVERFSNSGWRPFVVMADADE